MKNKVELCKSLRSEAKCTGYSEILKNKTNLGVTFDYLYMGWKVKIKPTDLV